MGDLTSEPFEYNSGIAQGDGGSPSLYCDFKEVLLQWLKANDIYYNFQLDNTESIKVYPQAWIDDLIILCHPEIATKATKLVFQFLKEYHMKLNFLKSKFLAINSDNIKNWK